MTFLARLAQQDLLYRISVIGREDELGSVETGKRADLVLLEGQESIQQGSLLLLGGALLQFQQHDVLDHRVAPFLQS